jgi:U32 family peptidase
LNLTPAKPELLAPAGSLEAFFAAMEAGADAVYLGLRDFSARAKAKNFSLGDLPGVLAYAHQRQRKVYVTLNTLVKERELPALVETLAELEAQGVDALILQDMAVWRLARQHFPGLELHSSTQMTVHNAAGVRMLERMGFTRAVLARELSLAEIAAIRAQTTMELEHFIHGALCFCFSGQCYFSSWLGGKSGNRGRCAQPCRRRYRYRQEEGYYFSTNDLSAVDLLPELAAAGICSFKIEGRMKSAEYVSSVVGAYRMTLDAGNKERPEAARQARELLKRSFGRMPTKGFLPGGQPTDIATPSLKGATGRFLGEISAERDGTITFRSRDPLHLGDRLRVQPRSDQAGTAFTIKELLLGKRPVKATIAGATVTVPSSFKGVFRIGDTVFKVSSEQAFTLSDAAGRRRLAAAPALVTPVCLTISLADDSLRVLASTGDLELERRYPVVAFAAESSPLNTATLHGVFEKTGEEPFVLQELVAADLPPVVIPPSRLKEIRRAFYRDLRQVLEEQRRLARRHRLTAAQTALLPATPPRGGGRREVTVAGRDLRDSSLLSDAAVDRLLLPLQPGPELARSARRLARQKQQIVWDLPFILFDARWPDFRHAVQLLAGFGFTRFRLNNLGHFPLFDGLEGLHLTTSYRLFSLNSQALLTWRELGASTAELYIEDERDNVRDLLARDAGIAPAMPVYGRIPLITSRIAIRGVRPDPPVLSDRSEAYRVESRGGLTILSSATDFSLLGRMADLQSLGCSNFLVDLAHLDPCSPAGRKILESLKAGRDPAGTSPFNYERGFE